MHMSEYSVKMLFSFGEGGTVLVFRAILWMTYLSTDKTNKGGPVVNYSCMMCTMLFVLDEA
jgi:hypothetical protein